MKKTLITRAIVMSAAVTLLGFSAVSCVDSDYDVSQDIDMTVGLGTDGLKFKLGSTQKILMKNVLEVDEDFKTDASNMYYLIKNGNTHSDFTINSVSSNIEDVHYTTDSPVIDYSKISSMVTGTGSSIPVSAGFVFDTPQLVKAQGDFKYTITDIDEAYYESAWKLCNSVQSGIIGILCTRVAYANPRQIVGCCFPEMFVRIQRNLIDFQSFISIFFIDFS